MSFFRFAIPLLSIVLFALSLQANTVIAFQNNSNLALNFEPVFFSAGQQDIPEGYFEAPNEIFSDAWDRKKTFVTLNEDEGIAGGPAFVFKFNCLQIENLSLEVEANLSDNGEPFFNVGATAPGATPVFISNTQLAEIEFQFDEHDYLLKFDFTVSDGGNYNFLYALHDLEPYTIDPTDLENPNVLNVMSYNMWMLPLGDGAATIYQRAESIVDYISTDHDVLILNEIFADSVRLHYLIPDLEAKGYTSYAGPANQEPENVYASGVMIFSKWPLVFEAEYHYDSCNFTSFDCFANKGIQYAKIEKLGRPYHIFGTHMEAGGDPSDFFIKKTQLAEMRNFIAEQDIPAHEAVIMGGDFNNSPNNTNGLWEAVRDSLNPILPEHIGYHTSTFGAAVGRVIDHVWVDRNHLAPIEANNNVVILRGIDDNMWRLFTLSDHLTALARLVFPSLNDIAIQTQLEEQQCVGSSTTLEASDAPFQYEWFHDGELIAGAETGSLTIEDVSTENVGSYQVNISSSQEFGTSDHILTPFFYPDGPETIENNITLELGDLQVVESLPVPEITWIDLNLVVPAEYDVLAWYAEGEIIDGEVSNTLSQWETLIDYTAETDNVGNCPNLISETLNVMTGIEEELLFVDYNLLMRENELLISSENHQLFGVAIFSLSGQVIFSQKDCFGETTIRGLQEGQIYICQLHTQQGIQSKKILLN